MSDRLTKNLRVPDETIRFPRIVEEVVDLGDLTVGRTVQEPGWRWSTHVRPLVGGAWCQARHVGVVLSGRLGVLLADGRTFELGPDDVFEIPPGHDGFTVGDEPCVTIEWSGLRSFARHRAGGRGRVLSTLLFTDLVGSTALAARLGEVAWRERISQHFESARGLLDRHAGREVKTTGDGLLAVFEAPASALRCAADLRRAAGREGLGVRAAVHVGEVEWVGSDVRGSTVHAAARILGAAGAGEVLVSDVARVLAGAEHRFDARGDHTLKGFPGAWALFAYEGVGDGSDPRPGASSDDVVV